MSYKEKKTDFIVFFGKQLCKMPLSIGLFLADVLGQLLYFIPNRRKKIAQINISHCFPKLTHKQQKKLLKDNLRATAHGIIEMIFALWADQKKLQNRFHISGLENITQAIKDDEGVLLLSCHTTSIELGIRGFNEYLENQGKTPARMLARANNNRRLEFHINQARQQFSDKVIDKKDIRSLLKSLKNGFSVYYAPDQNFSYQAEFIEFFSQQAATSIAPAKLAHSAKVKIIPWFCFRQAKGHWKIEICPPIPAFGQADYRLALRAMNQLFEQKIKANPEQYLWVHRRFKNRPQGEQNWY